MQRLDTKAMVEGAIFTAITALMGIIIIYIPLLSIMSYIWPVPIVIVGYRNGLKISILSAIAASIIISMFTTLANGAFLVATLGLPGIVMGYMLNRKIKVNIVVLITAIVLSITLVISMIGTIYIFSPSVFEKINSLDTALDEFIKETKEVYMSFGADEETIQQMLDRIYQMYEMLRITFPILIVVSNLPLAYMIFKLTRLILKRLGYNIDDMSSFSEWGLPRNIRVPALFLMAAALFSKYINISWLSIIAANISVLLSFVFLVIGISVVAFYLNIAAKKYQIPSVAKAILAIMIILIFMMFIPAIGIVDTALDIRKWASEFREV